MREIPIERIIEAARRMNALSATTKDWRLTRKIDREAKAEAQKLNEGRGYIIATPRELKAMYPRFVKWEPGADADEKMVWCFWPSIHDVKGRCHIVLCRA